MIGEPLKTTVGESIAMLQGGLGTPEYVVLPMIPPGSPLPSTNEARPADTQLLPVRYNRQ